MKKSPGRPKKNKPSQENIKQWNEAQKPVVEDVPTFSGEYFTLEKLEKDVAESEESSAITYSLITPQIFVDGVIHSHCYTTPHGGVELIPDNIFQSLKKHLLVEGVISAKDLIKSIEPELAAIFAEGKADNVADAITYFLNK